MNVLTPYDLKRIEDEGYAQYSIISLSLKERLYGKLECGPLSDSEKEFIALAFNDCTLNAIACILNRPRQQVGNYTASIGLFKRKLNQNTK